MSDGRLILFGLFMMFVFVPLYIIMKVLEVVLYPYRRLKRFRERQRWEQDYRNKLLFGDDYKEKYKW